MLTPLLFLLALAAHVCAVVIKTTSNSTALKTPYSAVVAFGASYQDNAHRRLPEYALRPKPYYEGRACNGVNGAEYLASSFNATLFDYAYYGAHIANNLTDGTAPDGWSQIDSFTHDLESQNYSDISYAVIQMGRKRVLYIWWLGIDSIIAIWQDLFRETPTNDKLADAMDLAVLNADILFEQIREIASKAVHADFLLLPLPPLQTIPTVRWLAQNNTEKLLVIQQLTENFNRRWNMDFAKFRNDMKGGDVVTIDIDTFWHDRQDDPAKFGYNVTNTPCLNPSSDQVCSSPSTYFYWDSLHPTTETHKQLAQQYIEAIDIKSYQQSVDVISSATRKMVNIGWAIFTAFCWWYLDF